MQTASSFQARRRARRGKRPERHSEHPLQGRVGAQGPTGRDAVPGPCSKMQLSCSKQLRPAVLLQGCKPPDGATTVRRLTAAQTHHALSRRDPEVRASLQMAKHPVPRRRLHGLRLGGSTSAGAMRALSQLVFFLVAQNDCKNNETKNTRRTLWCSCIFNNTTMCILHK